MISLRYCLGLVVPLNWLFQLPDLTLSYCLSLYELKLSQVIVYSLGGMFRDYVIQTIILRRTHDECDPSKSAFELGRRLKVSTRRGPAKHLEPWRLPQTFSLVSILRFIFQFLFCSKHNFCHFSSDWVILSALYFCLHDDNILSNTKRAFYRTCLSSFVLFWAWRTFHRINIQQWWQRWRGGVGAVGTAKTF